MPRFANTSCSQCGKDFGPGDHGFSHCENHEQIMTDNIKTLAQRLRIWIESVRGMANQPFVRLTISEAEECADLIEQQAARIAELEAALEAINTIRNSIIGLHTLNWSEHVYPLVAALDAAGVEGMDYPKAREFFGTMLDRCNAAEKDAERYRWLRNEHFPTADNPPLAQVVWKELDDRHGSQWANMIDGNDLDRAIDSALAASEPKKTGE